MKHSLLFSLLCLLLSALPAQDFSERFKVLANDRGTADRFGSSVALKGNRLLVGAPTERHNLVGANALQEAGSAYFFEKNAQGQWIQVQKIIASDRSAGANLGHQVVLGEQVALIAAHKDSTGLSGDSTYQEAGAVYVFRQDSSGVWQETQKLVASDRAPFDWFGHRVVMQGNRALISAWGRDNAGPGGQVDNRTGAVYAFEADSMGFWQQTQILALTDTGTSEEVGFSLAMDGDLALIGAPGETEDENGQNTEIRAGAAYVWEYLPNGQWQLVQKLVAPIRQFDIEGFGTNVAMKDSMLVIYQSFNIDFSEVLFSFLPDSSGTWKLKETITFGGQIIPGRAICMQDSFLLIGNPINQSRRGRGYLLRMTPTGSWEAVSDFVASDRRQNHEFAYSVAMDDSVLVFGARLEAPANPVYGAMGAVYVFETCTPDFPEQQASICTGDSLWFEGAYVSEAGSYEAAYLNEEGCDSVITLFLEVHPPVETGVNQTDSQLTALANQATFQWLRCDSMGFSPLAGETEAIFSPQQSGEYAVAITSLEGCSDTSACFSFGPPVSIEPNWAASLQLFPNPTSDQVQLLLGQARTLSIRVLDLRGRWMSQQDLHNNTQTVIQLPDSPGVYVIDIRDENGYGVMRKVMKR